MVAIMSVFCSCCKMRSSSPAPSPPPAPTRSTPLPAPPPPVKLPSHPAISPVGAATSKAPPELKASLPISGPAPDISAEPVEVGSLVVDDSDSGNGSVQGTRLRSVSSKLDFVKSRIRRRQSSDSLRRRSRVTASDSEEAVARRAELRRLRHKRIQEELQGEKTPSTPNKHPVSVRYSTAYHEELPGGGPRDNVEFAVLGPIEDPEPGAQEGSRHRQRDSSRSADTALGSGKENPASEVWQSSSGNVPRAASEGSYTAPGTQGGDGAKGGNGGGSPGAKSRSRVGNGTREASSLSERDSLAILDLDPQDQSPLSTWLRSQGFYSSSQSVTGSTSESQDGDEMIHEAQMVKLARPPSTIHDLDASYNRTIHLYDMDIHRQLRPRGPSSPTASPSRSPLRVVHTRGPSIITQASRISSLSLPPAAVTLAEPCGEGNQSNNPDSGLHTQASSIYPSSVYSERPSPVRSPASAPDIINCHKCIKGFQLSHFRRRQTLRTSGV